MPKLEIGAEVDLKQAEKQLDNFGNSVAVALGKASKSADGAAASIGKLGPVVSKIAPAANMASKSLASVAVANAKLDSSLAKTTSATNTAGQSLTNLGRIAQDAPFGFIGIQNNISPLLESFQRLKVETGSTGGAFKALAASLGGAGGLGLAVSVGTSLLTVLAQNGFFKTEKAADAAAEAAKKFKETISGIYSDAGKEAAQATALIAVLKSETETRERKVQALKDLKEINPVIFGQLKIEQGAVEGLDAAYQVFLANFKNVVAAKIIQAKLEAAITKQLELQGITLDKRTQGALAAIRQTNKAQADAVKAAGGASLEVANFQNNLDKVSAAKVAQATAEVEDLAKQLREVSSGVEIKIDKSKIDKASTKETVADVLAQLRRDINEANVFEGLFNIDKSKERAGLFESAIQKLVSKFKLDPQGALIGGLFNEEKIAKAGFIAQGAVIKQGIALRQSLLNVIQAPVESGGQFTSPLAPLLYINDADVKTAEAINFLATQRITKGLQDGVNVGVNGLRLPELTALLDSAKERLATFNSNVNALLQNTASNIFSGFGQGIADALTQGGDVFGGFFKTVLEQLGSGIQELGKYAIISSTLILSLKKTLGTTLGIGGGIALVALGGIIKSLAANIKPGFATGGYVSGPGNGTSDSINARLSNGEYVVKASAVDKFGVGFLNSINNGFVPQSSGASAAPAISGGGQSVFIPSLTLRGSDIVVAFNRASATNNRQQ